MTDTTDHKVKPYSPSAEYRYFLYDPNDSYTFYSTPEERDIAAKNLIEDYLVDGEWSEQVVDIYAGEATHLVSEVERIDKVGKVDEDGYDENGEYWADDEVDYKCNYGLRPLVPTPPAEGESDDEPCEICGGLGTIDETLGGYANSNHAAECPGCGGSGCVSIDATPPAEGEVGELVAWLQRTADVLTDGNTQTPRLTRAAELLQQQAAELATLRQLAEQILALVRESEGVAGLHLNGDVAPWDELLPGGRFERFTSLPLEDRPHA